LVFVKRKIRRSNNWLNIHAWRHANGDTLVFAGGHVEY
jgi:hypothetical protein